MRKLLGLFATLTACLSMFAGTNMCIKKQNGDILKFNVEDIYEVYYESIFQGDTTIIPPFIDSVVVDASSLPLEFEILSDSTAKVIKGDYNDLDSVNIPSKVRIDGKIYDVTSIERSAFYNC